MIIITIMILTVMRRRVVCAEPSPRSVRGRLPLSRAVQLLQRPPPGWRHYLNLDPSTDRSGTANCIMIDHFSAFEFELVALFLTLPLKIQIVSSFRKDTYEPPHKHDDM
jgi:hypothetical protein